MGVNEFIQIGTQLKKLRTEKGITQKKMAEIIGIPYSTYSNYENNNREPNAQQIKKIADALGVRATEILGYDRESRTNDFDVLGKDIRALRKKRGMTLKQVAYYSNCSPQLISQYEKGEVLPEPETLDEIVDTLDGMYGSEVGTNRLRIVAPEEGMTIHSDSLKNLNIAFEQLEEQALLADYQKLNDTGKAEARKRIKELTEIPRYTEKAEQPPDNQD